VRIAKSDRCCLSDAKATACSGPHAKSFAPHSVETGSQLRGDPTRVNSDANRVLAQDGNSSVNLASHGHCAGVFIGI
jgi:hypothetical protein